MKKISNESIEILVSRIITCADLSIYGKSLGSSIDVIYIDKQLTKDNHNLFTYARRLKHHGFKSVWTFNGNVFARYDYQLQCDSLQKSSIVKMLLDAKADKDNEMDSSQRVLSTTCSTCCN